MTTADRTNETLEPEIIAALAQLAGMVVMSVGTVAVVLNVGATVGLALAVLGCAVGLGGYVAAHRLEVSA